MRRRVHSLCLLVFCAASLSAQGSGRVVGTITTENGQPLAGANVLMPSARIATLTGIDGRFQFPAVPAGVQSVQASLIGYKTVTREFTVASGATSTVDFQLGIEAVRLEGIVATGYGSQDRRALTGAIGSIRGDEIRQTPTGNLIHAIQGRLPGVDIVATNYRPGAAMSIRVRGVRSMVASNDPLFVVNGIPIAGGIEDFNPADIESIEVLKDAAATAVYGSRGANGVVLITTRNDRRFGTHFSYDGYAGLQRPIQLVDMMNGAEFAAYKREAWRAAGRDTSDASVFSAEELAALRSGASTDWQQQILRTGLQQSHQVGVGAFNENTRFSFSGNYFDQRGITLGQDFERALGTLSLEHAAGRVRLGLSATAARSVTQVGRGDNLWAEALRNNPLGVPYDSNGVLVFRPTPDPLRVNPLTDVQGWRRELTRNRVFASLFSEVALTSGLSWRLNFGPDMSDRLDGEFHGPLTSARNGSLAEASRLEEETFAYTLDNLIRYDRNIGAHRAETTLLYSIQEERYERTRAAAQNLPYDQQLWYNLGTGEIRADLQSELREWSLQSFMGRLNYSFNDRYLVSLSGRFDGSSRLAPGNKWAFFPSIGLGWQVGEEPFLQDLDLFTNLKLRASYGRTGNTGIDPYQTQGSLGRTRYNFGNTGAFGYRPGQIPNPDLEWEKTDQLDIGVDFGVLGKRITGTIDYYRQDTRDLLMLRQLPATSGFTQTLQNIGETRNRGIEIGLSTLNVDGWNGLQWSTDISFSRNRNEIVSLYGRTQDDPGNFWFIGQPIHAGGADNSDRLLRVFYDYRFAGIWQENEAAEAARFGQRPGDIKVVDINGDGAINAADRVVIGSTYPKWTGSIGTRVNWRNLELSGLATARMGYTMNDLLSTTHNSLYGRWGNLDVQYYRPDRPSNQHPRPNAGREAPLYDSSRSYRDGSHIRIRNLTLAMIIPAGFANRWGVQGMRVYLTAQEPFVFSDYHGFDPENGDYATMPSYRTLLFGTSVSF